jgi:hypothetical protein
MDEREWAFHAEATVGQIAAALAGCCEESFLAKGVRIFRVRDAR